MNTIRDSEIRLKLLKLLKDQPQLTQRQMHKIMGVSLGKVNYCLSGLAEKGMIRVERFKQHPRKKAYIYRLTPIGIEELARLAVRFLRIRLAEYEKIKSEISTLTMQVKKINPEMNQDPELLEDLKKIV